MQTTRGLTSFASEAEWRAMRQGWRAGLFMAIADIADMEMQRRIWLNPQKPWDWWGEIYEGFFGAFPEGPREGMRHFQELAYLTEAEAAAISDLASAMDMFPASEFATNDAMLVDPRWTSVCQIASETVQRLKPLLTDENELRALIEGDPEWRR